MRFPLIAGIILVSSLCRAQGAVDAALGYVVRVEQSSVVLDFTEKNAAAGQPFTIFKEGAELKHPVTGKSLGRMETVVAEGSLKEVLPMYSVGTFSVINAPAGTVSVTPAQPITPGMRARLKPLAAPPPAQTAQPAAPVASQIADIARSLGQTPKREPRWRGPAFDYQATALTIGEIQGGGKLSAAVSDGRKVYLYPYPPVDANPAAVFEAPGTAPRIYSLDAADLDGDGRAEVFVSYFNDTFHRFETKVIVLDEKGAFRQAAELPSLVRSYQDPKGERRLAVQQVTEDASFPFGAIYPLTYKDGKYGPGKPAMDFIKARNRVDWIYDFTFLTLDNKPAVVDVTNTELVRVRFAKGSWKTSESYCQTPNRVRWTGDRMLHFRPGMAVRYDDKGFSGLYAIKNIGALGSLATPFGIFSRAELHRLDWTGLSLAPTWKAELGGFSTGMALVSPAGGAQELAVIVVGTAGRSSIWAYEP